MIDSLFLLFSSVSKDIQVLISMPMVISTHTISSFLQHYFSLLIIRSLCFSLSLSPAGPIPLYFLPVSISHKYSADLMLIIIDHNKLIEITMLFNLGTAHNTGHTQMRTSIVENIALWPNILTEFMAILVQILNKLTGVMPKSM